MDHTSNTTVQRLIAKTPQEHFLRTLRNEFHYAPRVAQAILEEAQVHLAGHSDGLASGQTRFVLARRDAGHGRPLDETETTEVVWTIDAGAEDLQVLEAHDSIALRRVRILRLLDEAVAQGAAATQEDLARALQISVSTIKRDFAALQAEGYYLPSRGKLQGIGRGQTHKAQIVELWLEGLTYDQIARRTHHAVSSIKRYINTFVRVVWLHRHDYAKAQIAQLLQIGMALTAEYLALYNRYDTEPYQERLEAQLERICGATAQPAPKKGAV
jgi:DNA-binding CsgD family transcriptional regulator